jgi:predicted nucleic acid-binding protein
VTTLRVVSNASPLISLSNIRLLRLLPDLFDEVYIPAAVWAEIARPGAPAIDSLSAATWLQRRTVQNVHLVKSLQEELDQGEAEAIALALELNANLILLDEKEGRHIAQRLGLRVTGVLGLLVRGKERGLLTTVRPALEVLRQEAGFWFSDDLLAKTLELADESSV